MECKIYLRKGERNNATTHYIDVLERSLLKVFNKVEYIDDIKELQSNDVVLIITMYALMDVWKKNFNQKIIYWWQGITPEELSYNVSHFTFRLRLRIIFYNVLEFLLLRKAKFNIFVSNTMLEHYRKKYRYKGENTAIMPCYNQALSKQSFFVQSKYSRPSFVYSGAMLPWQCVEETVVLYNKVKAHYPQATLTILTTGIDEAKEIVDRHNAADVEIKCVPVEKLNEEQAKYKYGMLLRADNIVNNVATPTKFNSYLAVGLIPVISDVVGAYKPILSKMKYKIGVGDEKDLDKAFQLICEMEETDIEPGEIYAEYKSIFDSFYNTENYINEISTNINKYVIKA